VPGDVRGDEQGVHVPQRVVLGERFGVGHVDGGPVDVVLPEGVEGRVRVGDRPPGDVDQHRVLRERLELPVTDKAAGRLRQRAGDHEVVRPREHLQEVLLAEPDDLVGRAAFEGVYTAGQNG